MVSSHHITYVNLGYGVDGDERTFHYEMTIRTRDVDNFNSLAEALRVTEQVHGFSIVPTGDCGRLQSTGWSRCFHPWCVNLCRELPTGSPAP